MLAANSMVNSSVAHPPNWGMPQFQIGAGYNLPMGSIIFGLSSTQNELTEEEGEEKKMRVALKDEKLLEEELKEKEQKKCKEWLDQMFSAGDHYALGLQFPSSPHPSSPFTASTPSQTPSLCESPFEVKKEEVESTSAAPALPDRRPHKCDQCQKSFRFKSNLFEHKSLHLGSTHRNPFVCPFCAKTCRLKGNLKKHLQVHVTSVEDLERLWKRSFSRQSGRPRKNAPPAPLPKPGDDLGLVPVLVATQQKKANPGDPSPHSRHHSPNNQCPSIQWTFADQQNYGLEGQQPNMTEFIQKTMLDNIKNSLSTFIL